jgi:mannose-6-phosphate isomerase
VALEVMANSDNVLRAGLTPKYIDIPELVANVKFEAKPAGELLTQPQRHGAELDFPIPVEDFAFSCTTSPPRPAIWPRQSAAIVFCVDGEAVLRKGDQSLTLKPGESAFVAANESPVQVSGRGRVARVFNKLQ